MGSKLLVSYGLGQGVTLAFANMRDRISLVHEREDDRGMYSGSGLSWSTFYIADWDDESKRLREAMSLGLEEPRPLGLLAKWQAERWAKTDMMPEKWAGKCCALALRPPKRLDLADPLVPNLLWWAFYGWVPN